MGWLRQKHTESAGSSQPLCTGAMLGRFSKSSDAGDSVNKAEGGSDVRVYVNGDEESSIGKAEHSGSGRSADKKVLDFKNNNSNLYC
jgi:hypothetical protein